MAAFGCEESSSHAVQRALNPRCCRHGVAEGGVHEVPDASLEASSDTGALSSIRPLNIGGFLRKGSDGEAHDGDS
eukprot:5926211-Pyramimonas_sp.AAC.1